MIVPIPKSNKLRVRFLTIQAKTMQYYTLCHNGHKAFETISNQYFICSTCEAFSEGTIQRKVSGTFKSNDQQIHQVLLMRFCLNHSSQISKHKTLTSWVSWCQLSGFWKQIRMIFMFHGLKGKLLAVQPCTIAKEEIKFL